MPRHTTMAVGSLMALALGAAGTLLAPAASATSPYANGKFMPSRFTSANNCTTTYDPVNQPSSAPLPADGAIHTFDQNFAATVTNTAQPNDISTVTFTNHMVGQLTTDGSAPAAASLRYSGSVAVSRKVTPSACSLNGNDTTNMTFDVTLSAPMWLDVATAQQGRGIGNVLVFGTNNDFTLAEFFSGKTTGTRRAYLPAGEYNISMQAGTNIANSVTGSMSGHMTAHFTAVGARVAGPSGNAIGWVHLGGARNCATHTLATTITHRKKRARTIRKFILRVNGHRVKTIRSHFRGRSVTLTLPDTKAANVKATVKTVTIKKRHHHKKKIHKTRTVSASYLPCS